MTTTIKPFDVYGNTQALDKPVLDAVATGLVSHGNIQPFSACCTNVSISGKLTKCSQFLTRDAGQAVK